MILQVQQLIKSALQDIGALAKSESPTADELTDGLTKLNTMIDAWSVRSLMVLGTILEGFALTAGKQAYTIGIGGDLNTPKPSKITDGFIRDGNNEDTGLDILTREEWDSITDKAIATGRPTALFFDPGITQAGVQTGVVNLYPNPDASSPYTLFIGEQKGLTEFQAPTDTVTFQSAYYEALEYNLAIRLWRQYHEDARPIPQDLRDLALSSMHVVEMMNARQPTSVIEVPGKRVPYNILTGQQ